MPVRLAALLATGALLCSTPPANAQPAADTSRAVPLPPVTIEAARETATAAEAPFAVSLLRREPADVRLEPAFSLDAVLERLPGVVVSNRSHFALGERLAVRGLGYRAQFGVRGVQVLLDGVPLTQPGGQATLDVVEPAVLRQVELLRGPSSRFWGNGAGGVLFLSTARRSEEPFGRVRAAAGSYGRQHLLAEGGGAVGPHYVQGFASEARRRGFRQHSAGRRARAGFRGRFRLDEGTQLRASGAFSNQHTENPSSLTRTQLRQNRQQARPGFVDVGAGKRSTQAQLGLTLDHRAGAFGRVSATAYGIVRDLENPLPFAFIQLDRRTAGARLAVQPGLTERLHLSLSADAAYQHDQRAEFNTITDTTGERTIGERGDERQLDQLETVGDLGAGAFVRYDLTDALQLSAGARLSRVRFASADGFLADGDQSGVRVFTALSPSVGASYQLGPALLFANYSTAFETPTTTELTGRPDAGGGFNAVLEPQRACGVEVGTRGVLSPARLRFDLALFYMSVRDALVQTGTNAEGREFFGNAGRMLHRGVEVALTWQALTGEGPLGLRAALRLRYDGGRFTFGEDVVRSGDTLRVEGNRLPGLPAHRFFASAEAGRPGGFWAKLAAQAASDAYVNDANTAETTGYVVLDLRAGHRGLGSAESVRLQPFVALANVFDAEYNGSIVPNAFGGRYYEPAPGRHVTLGFNVAF